MSSYHGEVGNQPIGAQREDYYRQSFAQYSKFKILRSIQQKNPSLNKSCPPQPRQQKRSCGATITVTKNNPLHTTLRSIQQKKKPPLQGCQDHGDPCTRSQMSAPPNREKRREFFFFFGGLSAGGPSCQPASLVIQ